MLLRSAAPLGRVLALPVLLTALLVGLLGPTDHGGPDRAVPIAVSDRAVPIAVSDRAVPVAVSDHDGHPPAPRPCAPPRPHCSMARVTFPAPGPQPLAVLTGAGNLLPGAWLAAPPSATAHSAGPAPSPASLQVFRL